MNNNDDLFREVFRTLHEQLNPKASRKEKAASLDAFAVLPPAHASTCEVQKRLLEMKHKEEQALLERLDDRFRAHSAEVETLLSASRLSSKV
eukprot:gene16959-20127_t